MMKLLMGLIFSTIFAGLVGLSAKEDSSNETTLSREFEPWSALSVLGVQLQKAVDGSSYLRFAVPVRVPSTSFEETSIITSARAPTLRHLEIRSVFDSQEQSNSFFEKWSSTLSEKYTSVRAPEAPDVLKFHSTQFQLQLKNARHEDKGEVHLALDPYPAAADVAGERLERSSVTKDMENVYKSDIIVQSGEIKDLSVDPPIARKAQLHVVLTWTWTTPPSPKERGLNVIYHSTCAATNAYVIVQGPVETKIEYNGLEIRVVGDVYLPTRTGPLPPVEPRDKVQRRTLFSPSTGNMRITANHFTIELQGTNEATYVITASFEGPATLDNQLRVDGSLTGKTEVIFTDWKQSKLGAH
jgi:hypothetical protein